jgi:hypothetical protein
VDVINPSTTMGATAASASPTVVHSAETVNLTFYEKNNGDVPLTNTHVTSTNAACNNSMAGQYVPDDPATPLVDEESFNSGDTDSDGVLDAGANGAGEQWTFTCSTSSTAAGTTVTVDAIGHGTDPLGSDITWYKTSAAADAPVCTTGAISSGRLCDLDERTTAEFSVVNPSTTLVKTASAAVTYTYQETNDGNGDISDVSVSDPVCGTVVGTPGVNVGDNSVIEANFNIGDSNHDTKLNHGETWTFTCTKTITGSAPAAGATVGTSVTNTATATCVVTENPCIGVTKTCDSVIIGQPNVVTAVVTNCGNVPLHGITVMY